MIDLESLDRDDPYEVLNIKDGIHMPAKKIGKAFNRLKHRARAMSDVAERARRLEQLERAKEQLQRPDDRVVLDFCYIGSEFMSDLVRGLGQNLGDNLLNTEKLIKGVLPKNAYDDLVPKSADRLFRELKLKGQTKHYADVADDSVTKWFK